MSRQDHRLRQPHLRTAISVGIVAVGLAGMQVTRPSAQVERFTTLMATGAQVANVLPRIDEMLRVGTLDVGAIQQDTMITGRVHERLSQMYEGLPVFGGQVVRQLSGRSIVSISGRLYEGLSLSVTPVLAPDAAVERARTSGRSSGTVTAPPVLGILPRGNAEPVLVYKVRLGSLLAGHVFYINANSGAVERAYSDVQTQGVIGSGTGVLGDVKKVSVFPTAGTFLTDDRLRPAPHLTFDFHGSFVRLDSFDGTFFVSDFATDSDNVWADGAVVDAHVYQGWTYDYFFKRFGRRSLDDRNIDITGIVHPLARADALLYPPDIRETFINNAFYASDLNIMVYGDGDGRVFDYFAGALDVVGHELSHGVTDFSSHLEYLDESGALNEAFSDIMAASIEFFYQPVGTGPLRADWLIAEDVTRVFPGFIRSMNNPIAGGQPDHYSLRDFIGEEIDNGGVHFNSGIVNHAFYLAVAGGVNRVSRIPVNGVGLSNIGRMEQIFYRAFVFYLGPNARFSDARAATLQAATDLYGAGSNDRAQVAQAWTAVGVN
ncbi:MAG: peptidase M4 family protein [Acidobacteria bacterium]|nr:MAG: peptidase M4 family protein [Acidobacteriota bacterium]